jgi:hypothetical protein
MTPDLSQITAETRRAYRYAGGDLNNAMWLLEFHNGHRRGLPTGERLDVTAARAKRFAQITAFLKKHGPQTALQISKRMSADKSCAADWLLRMHTEGRVSRTPRPIMGSGGYALFYSAKPTPRAARVAKTKQHASTGQNTGVSYDAE